MSGGSLSFLVPGPIGQRTGGSIYDRRMVAGLRRRGWSVAVHELEGAFPAADPPARAALGEALAAMPDRALVIVDFLAMAGAPDVARGESPRLALLALVHLLPADEPLLSPAERDRRRELEREALAASDGVIATSPFTARRVAELGVPAHRIRTVIPGTELAPLAEGPGRDAPPRLLCLAALTPGKGQAVLVEALAELADVAWTCVCAGSLTRDAAYAAAVERSARAAGLADRITFPGECDEQAVDGLYRTSSVFVLPSYFESYGMVLAEAMAHGLPIVSTTAGAIPETVPSDAGILVAPGDADALAAALRSFVGEPSAGPDPATAARTRSGAAGRASASTLPDWHRQAARLVEAMTALALPDSPR